MSPGIFEWHFREVIFKLLSMIHGLSISFQIGLRRMLLDLTDDMSTPVQEMAWCHQAPNYYPSQCWPRSLSPYGSTRPQWVKFPWNAQNRHPIIHPWSHGQHWRSWLAAWGHQAITSADIDPDTCRHMASLGHKELTHWGSDAYASNHHWFR